MFLIGRALCLILLGAKSRMSSIMVKIAYNIGSCHYKHVTNKFVEQPIILDGDRTKQMRATTIQF